MFLISLVIPTYGRYEEVRKLLFSISRQTVPPEQIEVIVVDQNEKINLTDVIKEYNDSLKIKHIKSTVKGVAYNKNLGLKAATADIITFPDDDCTFYEDTVEKALEMFKELPDASVIYGRVYDRERKRNVMRHWPTETKKLDKFNFHLRYSAITCFTRVNTLMFDERFGTGSKYGVGEELDYIMQALRSGYKIYYTPDIDVWHPELNVNVMSEEKTYYYALGYGATFRKNMLVQFLIIYLLSCSYQLLSAAKEFFKGDRMLARKRWLALKGRVAGFRQFHP